MTVPKDLSSKDECKESQRCLPLENSRLGRRKYSVLGNGQNLKWTFVSQ